MAIVPAFEFERAQLKMITGGYVSLISTFLIGAVLAGLSTVSILVLGSRRAPKAVLIERN